MLPIAAEGDGSRVVHRPILSVDGATSRRQANVESSIAEDMRDERAEQVPTKRRRATDDDHFEDAAQQV